MKSKVALLLCGLLLLPIFSLYSQTSAKGRELLSKASALHRQHKYKEALGLALKANEAFGNKGDRGALAESNVLLGLLYEQSKEYGFALLHFLQAIDYYKETKATTAECKVSQSVASMYADWGISKRAGIYWAQAAKVASSEGERLELYLKAAEAFEKGQQYGSALAYYKRLEKTYLRKHAYSPKIRLLRKIVELFQKLGQDLHALTYGERALKMSYEQSDWQSVAWCYNNLGLLYQRIGKYDKAADFFQKGIALLEDRFVGQEFETTYLVNLGLLSQNRKDYEEAFVYLERASKIFESKKERVREAQIENYLAWIRIGMKDYRLAKGHTINL